MNRPAFFKIAFIFLLAVYPFIIYFGIQVVPPSLFGILLVIVLLLRFGIIPSGERATALPLVGVLLIYAVSTAIFGSTKLLLYYPVLVNLLLFILFAGSLRHEEPFLLRIVRASGMPISEHGPRYLTRLTAVWAAFFVVNGAIAIWTTIQSIEIWTIYNGLVSYLLAATLMLCELAFRRHYKRRMGVSSE